MKKHVLLAAGCMMMALASVAQDTIHVTNSEGKESALHKVEVEAHYPHEGGWGAFIGKNLKANVPVKRKAPLGSYQVVVQFIVDKNGYVTEVQPLTSFGYGMEEEVMRVIKKSPKWNPAMQNGRPVKAYRKQPITFEVTGK